MYTIPKNTEVQLGSAEQKAAKAKEAIEVKKRVEKLEGMLRQLGINPDEIK